MDLAAIEKSEMIDTRAAGCLHILSGTPVSYTHLDVYKRQDIDRLNNTKTYFLRMKDQKCSSLEEALQRILFWSSLFWQSQHTLVGIGRLDKVLARYKLDIPESVQIIGDFYSEMHRYFAFKSSGKLLGDTGQIIVLGRCV